MQDSYPISIKKSSTLQKSCPTKKRLYLSNKNLNFHHLENQFERENLNLQEINILTTSFPILPSIKSNTGSDNFERGSFLKEDKLTHSYEITDSETEKANLTQNFHILKKDLIAKGILQENSKDKGNNLSKNSSISKKLEFNGELENCELYNHRNTSILASEEKERKKMEEKKEKKENQVKEENKEIEAERENENKSSINHDDLDNINTNNISFLTNCRIENPEEESEFNFPNEFNAIKKRELSIHSTILEFKQQIHLLQTQLNKTRTYSFYFKKLSCFILLLFILSLSFNCAQYTSHRSYSHDSSNSACLLFPANNSMLLKGFQVACENYTEQILDFYDFGNLINSLRNENEELREINKKLLEKHQEICREVGHLNCSLSK